MEIIESKDGNKVVLKIVGRLDTNTAPELDSYLKANVTSDAGMVFDLSELDYVSSAGLRVILATHKVMSSRGGLTITKPKDTVMEVRVVARPVLVDEAQHAQIISVAT